MENLTGGNPPVRPLPCVVPCKLYFTLGLKIAYYRKKAGLTREVLAERIGKSVNFVGQVEGTGTIRGVSLETLFKIAQVLKIQPSKLLEDD